MAKKLIFLFAMSMILLVLPFCTGYVEDCIAEPQETSFLPLSLQEIEEEAFSGTAVEKVVLPRGFLRIGEKAFDQAWRLTDVYIPDTTEYIAASAFSLTPSLTIHGIDGSYAMDWAYRHQIPFIVDDIWSAIAPSGRSYHTRTNPCNKGLATIVSVMLLVLYSLSYYQARSKRPQDRPELYPIDYRFP